jgi:hypothetical protein
MTAATTVVHHDHLRRLLDPSLPHHRRLWPLLVPDLGRKGGDGEERKREVDGVAPHRAERHKRNGGEVAAAESRAGGGEEREGWQGRGMGSGARGAGGGIR